MIFTKPFTFEDVRRFWLARLPRLNAWLTQAAINAKEKPITIIFPENELMLKSSDCYSHLLEKYVGNFTLTPDSSGEAAQYMGSNSLVFIPFQEKAHWNTALLLIKNNKPIMVACINPYGTEQTIDALLNRLNISFDQLNVEEKSVLLNESAKKCQSSCIRQRLTRLRKF